MTQHFPKHLDRVSWFCKREMKETSHRVLGGKLAFCEPCYVADQARDRAKAEAKAAEPKAPEQFSLFGGR